MKIILVDDHKLVRDGIKSLLKSEKEIQIIGEVSGGRELIELVQDKMPDIVITDISMPDMNGIELTRYLSENYPSIHVLILSMHLDENYIIDCVKLGARGYLPKDINPQELIKAIHLIHAGGTYFSHEISKIGFNSYIEKARQSDKKAALLEHLTEREIEIIQLVAEGLMNKEISDQLNISIRTVDNHKSNILRKLNLKSSIDIVKYAIKNEIIKL
jgi:DNA-binding NarL/FixJ family response regulator